MKSLLEVAKATKFKRNIRTKDIFKYDKNELLDLSWAWATGEIGAKQFCNAMKKDLNNSNYLYVIASVFKWAVQNKKIIIKQ